MGVDVFAFSDHDLSYPEIVSAEQLLHPCSEAISVLLGPSQEASWRFDTDPGRRADVLPTLWLGGCYMAQLAPRVVLHGPVVRWQAFAAHPDIAARVRDAVRLVSARLGGTRFLLTNDAIAQHELEMAGNGSPLREVEESLVSRLGPHGPRSPRARPGTGSLRWWMGEAV